MRLVRFLESMVYKFNVFHNGTRWLLLSLLLADSLRVGL